MCLTLCRALSRRGFLTLYRWNAAVRIQQIHRGFIIRKRLLAIRNRDFAYVDSELDSLLCADIADLLPFDDKIEGESDWKPSMPISLYVNTNRVNIGPEHICEGSNDARSNKTCHWIHERSRLVSGRPGKMRTMIVVAIRTRKKSCQSGVLRIQGLPR